MDNNTFEWIIEIVESVYGDSRICRFKGTKEEMKDFLWEIVSRDREYYVNICDKTLEECCDTTESILDIGPFDNDTFYACNVFDDGLLIAYQAMKVENIKLISKTEEIEEIEPFF